MLRHMHKYTRHSMTDNQEIQDLKDCLTIEQEEKNELNKKLQDLEKECEVSLLPFNSYSLTCLVNYTSLCMQNSFCD